MPDRFDVIENLFQDISMEASVQDSGPAYVQPVEPTGHFSTAQELIETPETNSPRETDPVFATPEHFLTGYPAPKDKVAWPIPFAGLTQANGIVLLTTVPTVLIGVGAISNSDNNNIDLYDASNLSTPFYSFTVSTWGSAGMHGTIKRIYFPHGIAISASATGTVRGQLLIERDLDSIPR